MTTCSLLLASALPDPTVLVEADLHGGVVAVRYGLCREPGLTTLAASGALSGDGWRDHAQDAGGVAVIVGPDGPDQARSVWRRAGERIGRSLVESDVTCVLDLGRLAEDVPLSGDLTMLVVLVCPVAEQLVTLSHQLPTLQRHARHLGVVLVGDGEYGPADVSGSLAVDVIGTVPHDHRTAEALTAGGRRTSITRSQIYRAISALAASIDTPLRSDGASLEPTP